MEAREMGLIVEAPEESPLVARNGSSADGEISSQAETLDSSGGSELKPAGGAGHTVRLADWLYSSHEASVLWLVVRLWLGYQWLNAGYQKIWGSKHAAFWFGGGAEVKGFATARVLRSTAGKGSGASYGWWEAFLHNFGVPVAPVTS